MFTGLVEGLGTVAELLQEGPGIRLTIDVPSAMAAECELGASVAINGCCLTVVSFAASQWSFQAGEETLDRTNLGRLTVGDRVNLERSLPANARLGGHFVLGHIDGVGSVDEIRRDGEWVFMGFSVGPDLAKLMVTKGSVAVDGVSLTVCDADPDRFTVALIPHTLDVTTLGRRAVGDAVNIETDILGKYVQKLTQQN